MGLGDFFQLTETLAPTHRWTLVSHDSNSSPLEALARVLADRIMELRCRGCPHHYGAWRDHANGGQRPTGASEAALKAFIEPAFGLPDDPNAVLQTHMEAFVAEQLWYFLSLEIPVEEIVRIEPPSFVATDRGGDGLVIHRVPDGYLMFRLWEIKKSTGQAATSGAVSRAYKQLSAKATEYLARYTVIGQELPDSELADFYGQLVDLWIEASCEAAVGVSVATSQDHIPRRCFTTFGQRFASFVDPIRLQGMLTAIGDFSAFTTAVRDCVWKGL